MEFQLDRHVPLLCQHQQIALPVGTRGVQMKHNRIFPSSTIVFVFFLIPSCFFPLRFLLVSLAFSPFI